MCVFCLVLLQFLVCGIVWVRSENCPSGDLIIIRGLAQKDQDAAIIAHDNVRQELVDGKVPGHPRAKYMKAMNYDLILAHKCSNVSKQCEDTPIFVKDKRWPCLTQHTYTTCTRKFDPNVNWDEAVNHWFSEKEFFTYPNVVQLGKDVSGFRQLAWADMDTCGCDFVLFAKNDLGCQKPFCKIYTCTYGFCANSPANIDQPPYETCI